MARAPGPPEGAPNVLVVLFDDLGFAQLGFFGGLGGRIRTPNLDRLAERGLRYQNFHTTALCSPSRAALLSGRNHHSVGVATIMERATGYPGYNGRIPKDSALLPAVLRQHGYATMALGRWGRALAGGSGAEAVAVGPDAQVEVEDALGAGAGLERGQHVGGVPAVHGAEGVGRGEEGEQAGELVVHRGHVGVRALALEDAGEAHQGLPLGWQVVGALQDGR